MVTVAYAHRRSKNTYNIDQFNISLYADRRYGFKEKYGVVYQHEPNVLEYKLKKFVTNEIVSSYTTFPEHWSVWDQHPINTNIISMRNRYLKYVEELNKNDDIKMEKWIVADIGKGQRILNAAYERIYNYNLRVLANHINIDNFINIPRYSRGMVNINVDTDGNPFAASINKPTVSLHMKAYDKEYITNILCDYIDILCGFSIITFMKSREYAHRVKSYFDGLKYYNYQAKLINVDINDLDSILTFEITYLE